MQRTTEIEFVRGSKADDSRTVALSFASETPVQRTDWETGRTYNEILSHQPGDVDLSRLNNGHPLLLNHDKEKLIGVVESARVDPDLKARALVRLGKSPLATEVWNDIRDNIRRLVSVGYQLGRELSREMKDGIETVRYAWRPYEVSIVSIPADASIGIGRSITSTNNQQRTFMNQSEHLNEITEIARRLESRCPGIRNLEQTAIASGMSLQEFRDRALQMLPQVQPVRSPEPLREVRPKDWKNYSLSRAIINHLDGKQFTGLERELSDEIAVKTGKRAAGFWLPNEVLCRNFVAGTGTLGGMLVQTDNLANEFIELLRNKSQVVALGARVLSLSNPVTIPRQSAAGVANWVSETAAATLSTGNFTQITLTPYGVSAFQQYSKQLLFENNPSIDSLIRDDITAILGLAIDLAALHGTGSGQPTGIVGTTGIGTVALASNGQALGNSTAYPAMVSLETLVSAANADMGALAYLARPAHRGALKTAQRFSSTDSPVWETRMFPDGTLRGTVNGYRAEVTNQLATNLTTGTATTITSCIILANWNDILIGNFNNGAVDILADPYSLSERAIVKLVARQWVDLAVKRPASVAVLGGIL